MSIPFVNRQLSFFLKQFALGYFSYWLKLPNWAITFELFLLRQTFHEIFIRTSFNLRLIHVLSLNILLLLLSIQNVKAIVITVMSCQSDSVIFIWFQVHYDRYNKRFGKDGIHETLTWVAQTKDVEDFKDKFIYPEMIEGEVKVT